MSCPTLAVEPPTPKENPFQYPDGSVTSKKILRLQTPFSSPPNTSFYFQDPRHIFHSSPTGTFSSSPLSSPATLFCSPGMSNDSPSSCNISQAQKNSFEFSPGLGVPIARSSVKGVFETTYERQKRSKHHRDLSGTSSTASSVSTHLQDFYPFIDPSALQPPLSQFTNDFNISKTATNQIVSPFINQTLETNQDGTMTGRYQRPLTSTGRPSHARKTPPGHVKRPRNAFILFRSHACSSNLIPPTVEKDHRQISRIVSHMWRNLPASERLKWERDAEAEKELHRKLHPDYRYKPVYRKEAPGTKKQGATNSDFSKKKIAVRKKTKGIEIMESDEMHISRNEYRKKISRKTSAELRQQREEQIRCEIVAKVVMETKLAGITLDETQLEARVFEEIGSAQRKEGIKSQLDVYVSESVPKNELDPTNADNANLVGSFISTKANPGGKFLGSLQLRRKSQLSRANSAPPPPSPRRPMDSREVVYNPKARGSRELSPDFPKPRMVAPDEDIQMGDYLYPSDYVTPQILLHNDLGAYANDGLDYSRFADPNHRDLLYNNYQFNPTPSQELVQLFHNPDFTFADVNCFSRKNPESNSLRDEVMTEQRFYPAVQDIFADSNVGYRENLSAQAQLANYTFNSTECVFLSSEQLSRSNQDLLPLQIHRSEDRDWTEEVEDCGTSKEANQMNDELTGNHGSESSNLVECDFFPTLTKPRNSVLMSFTDEMVLEAVERAKRKATFGEGPGQNLLGCASAEEMNKRRQSIVLSGLGEFPVLDFSSLLPDLSQTTPLQPGLLPSSSGNGYTHFSTSASNEAPEFGFATVSTNVGMSENTEDMVFSSFLKPFEPNAEISNVEDSYLKDTHVSEHAHIKKENCQTIGSMQNNQDDLSKNIGDLLNVNRQNGLDCHINKTRSFQTISCDSTVTEKDGKTYVFLTREQAATEGLIPQILEAGFGVTYETDGCFAQRSGLSFRLVGFTDVGGVSKRIDTQTKAAVKL
ncbi:hypothetical protein O181_011171 [Austropuccinia psidii MF-1]|uniref:HMG box domain-containing protein n=1 Tax=Austropuccinia psidii MF-1 TaxID=1389203 RepID=A0A9Q3BVA0_9BASI|nr:hypothetical protein [Austropuccinia psidii MF-1]